MAALLILRDCRVAINTLFKHFLRSGRPQLSSACTKNQLSNVPSESFNLKRNRPRNLLEQICNLREQVVRAGCKLLRANCQSKYQHCGGSLQSCAEKNIRFDCNGNLRLVVRFCQGYWTTGVEKVMEGNLGKLCHCSPVLLSCLENIAKYKL